MTRFRIWDSSLIIILSFFFDCQVVLNRKGLARKMAESRQLRLANKLIICVAPHVTAHPFAVCSEGLGDLEDDRDPQEIKRPQVALRASERPGPKHLRPGAWKTHA